MSFRGAGLGREGVVCRQQLGAGRTPSVPVCFVVGAETCPQERSRLVPGKVTFWEGHWCEALARTDRILEEDFERLKN